MAVLPESTKKRVDLLLVEQGLAPNRRIAQAMILKGEVLLGDRLENKPGHLIASSGKLRLKGKSLQSFQNPYVSRGGLKLKAALDQFQIEVQEKIALDIGSSTGGFTDCLLQHGARKVYAVDGGTQQMVWSLRSHPQVVLQENLNARYLKYQDIGQAVDIIVMDVSFISVEKIIPNLLQFAQAQTEWVILIKPQFEVGKGYLPKGGVLKQDGLKKEVVERIQAFVKELGFKSIQVMDSPIFGAAGNQEFLMYLKNEKPFS